MLIWLIYHLSQNYMVSRCQILHMSNKQQQELMNLEGLVPFFDGGGSFICFKNCETAKKMIIAQYLNDW